MITPERKQEINNKIATLLGRTLEEIARDNGIKIYTIDLSDILTEQKGEVSGLIRLSNDTGYTIFINNGDPDNRKRFTLAHELGHFFLHNNILANEKSILDTKEAILCRISKNNEDFIEQEANFFAAGLLMPENIIRQAWALEQNIPKLADAFFVSELALTYRLINLGLINNE